MTERRVYLEAAIRLYLEPPGAPHRASRDDWAIAATLHDRAIPLETLAHAIRLAILRRVQSGPSLEPVRSLAYYRRVLDHLTPEDLQPGYVAYVHHRYEDLLTSLQRQTAETAVSDSQNPALSGSR